MKRYIKLLTLSLSSILVLGSCTNAGSSSIVNPTSTPTPTPTITSTPTSTITPSTPNSTTPLDKSKNLVVYAVNDTHGKIEEDADDSIAGLAKLREYIYQDKDYDPNYSIIVSAGDMFQGAGLSNLTLGKAMTAVMNAFPFDALTLGNHEFDWGLNELLTSIDDLRTYDILACNIFEKATGKAPEGIVPSTIVERGGYKVGIVGSIQHGINSSIAYNKVKDYLIEADQTLATAEARRLKEEEGADFVIFATHQGLTSAVSGVAQTGYIDLAILGHTHAYIDNFATVDGKTIPLLEASSDAKSFSKTVFNSDGYVSHDIHNFTPSEINNIQLSTEMENIISQYTAETEPILNEVIATVDGPLRRYSNGSAGSLGTLITKTLYDFGVECGLNNVVGVHNVRGVRGDFTKDSYPASMTYGDIYTFSPFDNEVKYVTISGSGLASAVSGHYVYPNLERETIDRNLVYNVVTIDYLTTSPGYPLYAENGGEYPGGENYFIRDLLKTKWKEMKTINVANYPFY